MSGLSSDTRSVSTDLYIELGADAPEWLRVGQHLDRGLQKSRASDSNLALLTWGAEQYFELRFPDGTQFVIDGAARKLWGTCHPPLCADDLAVYLRGPALGLVLRRRGVPALHASAVSIYGSAVVFCGPSQAGKSVTATALARINIPVLCDDIAAFAVEKNGVWVESGYPRICLWPDAVETLFGNIDALPRLTPSWDKRFLELDGKLGNFEPVRKRLGIVYLLGPRSRECGTPRIEPVEKREALIELVQNTYMNWLLDPHQRSDEFDLLSKLVTDIPVRRIVPNADPTRIGELSALILNDACNSIAAQETLGDCLSSYVLP